MTTKELKVASTEGLVSALEYCGRDSYYADYYDKIVLEITKRLNRATEIEKKNAELSEWIEKMKNCNNCKHKNYNWSFQPICTVRKNDDRDIENPIACKCDKWELTE